MVEQDFIDHFKIILTALIEARGEVLLFALLKMDDLTDRWTVILSADWVNDTDRGDVFFQLRNLMVEHLEQNELSQIARFGIFEPKEHLVELLLENFKVGEHITKDHQVNGNLIHEGYILAANEKQQTTELSSLH